MENIEDLMTVVREKTSSLQWIKTNPCLHMKIALFELPVHVDAEVHGSAVEFSSCCSLLFSRLLLGSWLRIIRKNGGRILCGIILYFTNSLKVKGKSAALTTRRYIGLVRQLVLSYFIVVLCVCIRRLFIYLLWLQLPRLLGKWRTRTSTKLFIVLKIFSISESNPEP